MFTHLPHHGPHPHTAAWQAAARLRRLAAVLTAVTCGLLASAAIVPAAFAMVAPNPGGATRAPRPRLPRRPPWSPPAAWRAGRSP